jgi:beta-galactosidase
MVVGAQMSGYDLWGPHPNDYPPDIEFEYQERNPRVYGEFVWTGFDYIGEPDPCAQSGGRSSYFGIFDLAGIPEDRYWLYKSHWRGDVPSAHILPHWTHEKGEIVRVMAVSNCEEVELFLNGKSLGRKPSDVCETPEWQVEFERGRLSAKAYKNGKCVAKAEQRTAGKPYAIQIHPDATTIKNDGADTAILNFCVVDKKGVVVPNADHLIRFEIEGDGYIRGVGNGDPNSHEPDHLPYRKLYCGLCQVLVTAKTKAKSLKLIARGEGLEEAQITLQITEQPIPDYIYSKPNLEISGILTSVSDSAEKPDPAKIYSDNDMNSFAPMSVSSAYNNAYCPGRFESGWRELRIPIELPDRIPEGKAPILKLASVIAETVEFYRNGTLIYQQNPAHKASVSVPLPADTKTYELRCLIKAAQNVPANGISISIALTMEDK